MKEKPSANVERMYAQIFDILKAQPTKEVFDVLGLIVVYVLSFQHDFVIKEFLESVEDETKNIRKENIKNYSWFSQELERVERGVNR